MTISLFGYYVALWITGSLGTLALWLLVWWSVGRLTGWHRGGGPPS